VDIGYHVSSSILDTILCFQPFYLLLKSLAYFVSSLQEKARKRVAAGAFTEGRCIGNLSGTCKMN